MYMYQRGDIVLVPFPFSDLSSSKTRPAIVVSIPGFEETTGNFIVAMVTSVRHETPYDYEIKEWKTANLLTPSWVRMKLVSLEPHLVRYKPGKLTQTDLSAIDRMLRTVFDLQ